MSLGTPFMRNFRNPIGSEASDSLRKSWSTVRRRRWIFASPFLLRSPSPFLLCLLLATIPIPTTLVYLYLPPSLPPFPFLPVLGTPPLLLVDKLPSPIIRYWTTTPVLVCVSSKLNSELYIFSACSSRITVWALNSNHVSSVISSTSPSFCECRS